MYTAVAFFGVLALIFWSVGLWCVRDRYDYYVKKRTQRGRMVPADGIVIEVVRKVPAVRDRDRAVAYLPRVEFRNHNGDTRSFYSQTGSSQENAYVVGQTVKILLDPLEQATPLLKGHRTTERYPAPGRLWVGVGCIVLALMLSATIIGLFTGMLEFEPE